MFTPKFTSPVNRWWQTVAATVGFVVVVLGVAGTVGVVMSIMVSPLLGETPATIVAGLSMCVGAVGLVMLSRRLTGHGWKVGMALVPRGRDIALFAVGTIMMTVLVATTHAVAIAVGWSRSDMPSVAPSWSVIGMALVVGFVVQGFPEELVFRGYVINVFAGRRLLEVVAASAVSFGVIHLLSRVDAANFAQQLMWMLMATLLGAAFALLRIGFDSLWIAVGAHGGFHLARTIAAELSPYRDLAAESVVLTVALAVLCGLLAPLASRRWRRGDVAPTG